MLPIWSLYLFELSQRTSVFSLQCQGFSIQQDTDTDIRPSPLSYQELDILALLPNPPKPSLDTYHHLSVSTIGVCVPSF